MKTIILKVKIKVPDDYVLDDEVWLLEDAMVSHEKDITIESVSKIEQSYIQVNAIPNAENYSRVFDSAMNESDH